MTAGTDALIQAFRLWVTDNVPASGANWPNKAEIIAGLTRLAVDIGAAQAGLTTVSNIAARDTFYANADNRGKLVYVNNNNGSATDPANGVYEYVSGAARLAQGFYAGITAVVQPLVDDAQGYAGFDTLSAATAFAPKMSTGETTTVRETDTGTHAAVAGEVRLDGTAATVGEAIPNEGGYTKQSGGALLRTRSTGRQLSGLSVASVTAIAASLAAALADLVSTTTQIIGRPADPITGSAASAGGILINDPIVMPGSATGTISSVKVFVLATGAFTIGRYTKSGTTYTRVATYTATLSSTGLKTLAPADFGVSSIPVMSGEYLVISAQSRWPTSANAADKPYAAVGEPTATASITAPSFVSTSRLEVQVNLQYQVRVVTAANVTALQTQVAALATNDTLQDASIALLKQVSSSIIGRTADPITATSVSVSTSIFGAPVPEDTFVSSVKIFSASSSATLYLARATKSGTTYTVQAVSNPVAITATGARTLTPTDYGAFPVSKDDYILLLGAGILTHSSNPTDTGGWYYSGTVATTVGTQIVNPSTLGANDRLEVQVNLSKTVQPVTAAAFTALDAKVNPVDPSLWRAIAEICHFIIYGQSLALGWSAGLNNTTALAYATRYNAGVRSQDGTGTDAQNRASLTGLLETAATNVGETQASGMAKMLAQLFLADGIDVTAWNRSWLFSAPGSGGTAATGLINGTVNFTRLLNDITYAPAAAAAFGKPTYAPQIICYEQGQQDYANGVAAETWKTLVRSIRTDAQTQARTTTGLPDLVLPMLLTQISSHLGYSVAYPSIALAQADLHAESAYCVACPEYFLPPNAASAPHLNANGYEWMGAYWAVAFYRWIIKGRKPDLMRPTSVRRMGNHLIAKYPVAAGKKLVVDTAAPVGTQTNLGFTCVDASGTAVTLSNARLVSNDEIAVLCASTPTAGWKLRYGFLDTTGGTVYGKGNIRDNAGDTLTYVGSTNLGTKPMHNWALHSETTVT